MPVGYFDQLNQKWVVGYPTYERTIDAYLDLWKVRAFVRYLEIWGSINRDDFIRGMYGTNQLGRSVSGLIGALNGMTQDCVKKRSDGKWVVTDWSKFYQRYKNRGVKPWSKEAKDSAREFSRKINSVKKSA